MTARKTPPPLFGITILPFGAAVGYMTIAAPRWLGDEGVSLALIGTISATAMTPHAIKFVWAPLLDIGTHRKLWYGVMTALTAIATVALALVAEPAKHLGLFTLLATVLQVAGTTSAAAADGLMAATTADDAKGRAGGWRMAGNVGGTGIIGGGLLWVGARWGVPVAGVLLAVLVAATCAALFFIDEPHDVHEDERGASALAVLRARLVAIGKDLWLTTKSREGWTGLVICLMPVGAGALTNLFSAIGIEYQASVDTVAWVNGIGGGIAGAVGSLLGGWMADRMNRRLAYALSGAITALSALAMLAAPMNPTTFTWGTLAYNFANGIAFAALAAFILEMVGHSVAVTTKYTLFIAIANVASNYVTAADGWASEINHLGARGSLICDAVLTFAGIAVLLAMVWLVRSKTPARAASA